ncbi:hypothetical protein A361_01105 [Cytobacillus oceanisediminis 2691]|uniref:Phage-Barnase-EndoU-ColicinE5/D-RelE like nuclease 4 domain-containing protein n=1 Tax=Cytobacillus oceanisediminis 2691 TaxID=1196031 RepID=A0A160M5Y5_9BACI|nr:hypothetical protein A361_01105 [Cytobacillus oceanisediminis 2691]
MITSIHQLYNLAQSPKINEISLSLLCDFYDSYLNPYTFQYRVLDTSGDKPITFTVNLKFDKENFCHLLAIEKIVQRVKNSTELKQFKSLDGWNNVKNGTITIPSLRQKPTKKVFNNNKDKYVFFYILPKLLDN